MSKSAQQLRAMREWLGLSQNDLALKCRISKYKVQSVEEGHKSSAKSSIETYLDKHCTGFEYGHIFHLTPEQLNERNALIERKFEVDKYYFISDSDNKFDRRKSNDGEGTFSGTTWNNDCIFKYIGKHGIHHCFKEIHGGWSRTYTDPQLVGKYIKEVK